MTIFTTGEVAKICEVAPHTVVRWVNSGLLKGYKIPLSEHRRVMKTDLIKFLEDNDMANFIKRMETCESTRTTKSRK